MFGKVFLGIGNIKACGMVLKCVSSTDLVIVFICIIGKMCTFIGNENTQKGLLFSLVLKAMG